MGKMINGRISSRCNKDRATPYMRKMMPQLYRRPQYKKIAVDLGCGNLRNSMYVNQGFKFEVVPYDMAGDYGNKLLLGQDRITRENGSVHLVLCNYLLMFLTEEERDQAAEEMTRIAKKNAHLIVELYEVKTGLPYEQKDIEELFLSRGWEFVHKSKNHFTMVKTCNAQNVKKAS